MTMVKKSRPINILLIEDNPGDVYLTRKAFKKAKIANNLQVAEDGEIALSLRRREEGFEEAQQFPVVVLADGEGFGCLRFLLAENFPGQ